MGKFLFTLKNIKKTAYHHYGKSWLSWPKLIFYSVFNINTFILYEADLNEELPPYPLDPEFTVIKPTIEELDKLRQGKELPREFYYDRIHGVKTCYVALHGEEIVHIYWVYFKGDYSRFLVLGDGVAELNYNTTLPKFRGRGLMSKMQAYILRDLKREGYRKAVGLVHENNIPAHKSAMRIGFKEIKRIRSIGQFNRKIRV